ncbi:MAG: ABC-2 family transporter protein [Bacillota bacterium]
MFSRFGAMGEWTLPEVALFYGMVHVAFALTEAWSRGFDTFGRQVQTGHFDRVLLRPRSIPLQVLGQEFQLMRVERLVQGTIVLLWAAGWTLGKGAWLVAAILGGPMLFSGLFVLQATMCFWIIETLQLANTVTHGGVETAQYPLSIYTKGLRELFTFVVPLACTNYFPALAVLG